MGKITNALRKAAEERIERIEKRNRVKDRNQLIVKAMKDSTVDPRVVAYFDPKALVTEQYKILRTNVLSLNKVKPPKMIVVTSSLHSEGKTITSLNLAMTMAQTTHRPRILLIDADMRRGRMERYLGVEQESGLSDVLCEKVGVDDVLYNIDIENLTFMASGPVPENPAELLASDKMRHILVQLKAQFDFVLIDTPPIIAVTDAGILGAMADGVIMVIQAGRTQRGIVKRATELLHQTHAKILGHVLTNIEYHLPEYIYRYL